MMIPFYRSLLRLFPGTFRERYQDEMLRTFAERRRDAAIGGRWQRLCFDTAAFRDLLVSAAAEAAYLRRPSLAASAQDLRFAVRMLWRRPGLSFFSVVTLGLGIGATTAIAALIQAVLIEPLPFPQPAAIVTVRGALDERPAGISYENLRDLQAQATTLSALSPFFAQSVNLTGVAEPDRLRGGFVTSGFFDVVVVPPAIGVPFGRDADTPNGERVAVLTDSTWRHRFGGRHDIVGRQIQLNNAPFTIVGVMPASFRFPIDEVEVLLPFWTTTAGIERTNHNYIGIARLSPGSTPAQAGLEAAAIAATLERVHPDVNRGRGAIVHPLKDYVVEDSAYSLQLLATMVGIMVIAACANVAGLQLGAAAARRREIAVRAALGAGRLRIARQLLIESLVRAALGAVLGIAAGRVAIRFLVTSAPAGVYGIENARLSLAVVAVAVLTALLAGIAAGLPPALQWARTGGAGTGRDGDRSIGDSGTSRLRNVLVVCQVALAVVLLVATGLTLRSFAGLTSADVGFDSSQLLTMEYRLPRNKYETPASQVAVHRELLERIRALPGVVDAAGVRALPFSGNGNSSSYRLEKAGESRRAAFNAVSDRYFETMRIPILTGRVFHGGERSDPVVVVSRALAERAWPGSSAIGRKLYFDEVDLLATVIGVVGDVRHRDLADADDGTIYTWQEQNPGVFNTLAIRTAGPASAMADPVKRAVWAVDPDQPVWKIRTIGTLIEQSLATRRFLLQLVAFFGISAGALAVLGLYGVVASLVTQRTREIGIRVAIGATSGNVLSLVLWTGLRLAAAGIGAGIGVALVAANLLRSFLYAVGPHDPLTFAFAAVMLVAAALLACWIPAVRALRVDPVVALRQN